MKVATLCLVFVAIFPASLWTARLTDAHKGDAVGKVVKMLQDMLTQSKDNWKSDKEAYDKFKCYCDDNTDLKTTAIQTATKSIGLLQNKIDQIKGSNGALSVQTAQLKADLADNVQDRDDAKALREKENKAFLGEETDLKAAIGQMDEAIKLLAAIGADQTKASGADHEKFMGNYKSKSLVSIRASVKQALTAAASFNLLEPAKKAKVQAFLQAPFTGSYGAQSGQIVGILSDMKDTFKSNLQTAKASEKASQESYDKFKKNKEDEHGSLKKSFDTKQADMGTNDGDLSSKKTQLQQSSKQKGEDEDFLSKVTVQCADKAKEYETRKIFVANEDLALSQAIAILDNDVAKEKFGAVDATSTGKTGAFLQMSDSDPSASQRAEVAELLQKAVQEQHSERLGKVLMLVSAGNPFTVILQQIGKMVKLADDEQTVDDEEKAWCEKTTTKNKKNVDGAQDDLDRIQGDIVKLGNDINDPASGLKKQMTEAEDSLKLNLKNQGEETKTRRTENVEYQKDVSTMRDSVSILSKSEKVLKGYYESLDNEQVGFLQEDPAPPKTFEGDYKGQNEQAKKVLGMLAFIKAETIKEETVAHDAELKGQHDYEDSMKSLVDGEASLQESIAKLNQDLAGAEKELVAKHQDETNTEEQKTAMERYAAKIKPGCDFITTNYADRKTGRAAEKKALEGAKTKLAGTPAFKAAQQKAKEDGFGKCKATCLKNEADAKCKACLAGVSVPGYCAGHKGAQGC